MYHDAHLIQRQTSTRLISAIIHDGQMPLYNPYASASCNCRRSLGEKGADVEDRANHARSSAANRGECCLRLSIDSGGIRRLPPA